MTNGGYGGYGRYGSYGGYGGYGRHTSYDGYGEGGRSRGGRAGRALVAGALAAALAGGGRATNGSAQNFTSKAAGTTTGDFLRFAVGARPAGLGEAFTALADDASAVYWNPAGLTQLARPEATLMHARHVGGVSYSFLAAALPLRGRRSGLGMGLVSVDSGEIRQTDELGRAVGSFRPRDEVLTLSGAQRIPGLGLDARDVSTLGLSAKLIRSRILGRASGWAFDLAGLTRFGPARGTRLSVATAFLNLGPGLRYDQADSPLPVTLKAAAALSFSDRLALAAEAVFEKGNGPHLAAGAEYRTGPLGPVAPALRAGYNSRGASGLGGLSGLSLGLGFRRGAFGLDYATVPFGELGLSHRLSLSLAFGRQALDLTPLRPAREPLEPLRLGPEFRQRPFGD